MPRDADEVTDIELYCLYCQRQLHKRGKFISHIRTKHPGTYAYWSVLTIEERNLFSSQALRHLVEEAKRKLSKNPGPLKLWAWADKKLPGEDLHRVELYNILMRAYGYIVPKT